jgi:protein TonB
VLEDQTPPPAGAIPYGEGGAPSLPYTQFTLAGSAQGGLGFSGPGGDFGSRFPWYVDAVRRRISSNWLQSTVDPSIRWAPRVVVTFQVLRDGTIVNLELLRSSGNASVDNSAVRAIRDSSSLERLPSEYQGSHVMVEFWFDFRR